MKKIALIGSPGSGKTTIANGLFYFLKTGGNKCEIVPELIKYKVYQGLKFGGDGFDILNTLEQKELEEIIEKAPSIDYIICEAPLCNGYFYSSFYKKENEVPVLKKIAQNKINTYDLIIFVEQDTSQDYETFGRKEDKETSLKIENHIKNEIVNTLNYTQEIIFVNKFTDIKDLISKILSL